MTSKLRYFDASGVKNAPLPVLETVHSDFLRTGRIARKRGGWAKEERRYLTHEQVAEVTARKLQAVGERAHEKINSFHKSINLPKLVFNKILEDRPHLGYCHVTAAKTKFAEFEELKWSFYIANFCADIGENDRSMSNFNRRLSRMYFAVSFRPDEDRKKLVLDRKVRGNGVIFRTSDPTVALKNVLMLGTKSERLREIIRRL